tara:strand:- start:310 stop:714 length:405 start_codon:yes stop_codon:yes gene_type:complete
MRVFTNGCFDVLHRGHIELFKYCDKLAIPAIGGSVIVGINSDESVKRLKGNDRPFNKIEDRVEMLRSIKYVNQIIVFEEDTPYELIKEIKPQCIVKGGDYDPQKVVGADLCEVKIFNYMDGYSTTNILENNGHK